MLANIQMLCQVVDALWRSREWGETIKGDRASILARMAWQMLSILLASPLAFPSTLQRLLLWLPGTVYLKAISPARDGDGRMLGLEAWQTRCVSHLQPLEELLEQMSMFPKVRLTLKCMLHGPLRSLVTLSASCPPGDCRVAYLYQIRAPSALTWPS